MGPFCSFWVLAPFVFCWGLRPSFGRVFFPPEKGTFRPSLRGVCVRSGRIPCHHTTAGGPSVCCVQWSNEAATANADIEADHLDVPVHLV